jgi:anti-anti-sigma regulatory factor
MAAVITASGTPLTWSVSRTRSGVLRAQLRGDVNENCDLTDLQAQLRGTVELDLESVTRVNSCGVREWVNFMRSLGELGVQVSFVRCSPAVVLQLNTIYNFRGRARIRSFFAPYVCEVCRSDEYRLLNVNEHFPDRSRLYPPSFRCDRCFGVMVFDELPERYLSFLHEDGAP